eukprot:comp9652_c0_seq1/m.4663 comp9652_c0_seq1/g.4663  ORF comp9652_c0_seq1/g.4663 comp9652_c0_seq1/m.4663 type:complete len:225 (-) comp9652_c0_seq1:140-814(-)
MDDELKKFLSEVSESERDFEVERVIKSFKLNPWDQLGVEFGVSENDLNKIYRKKSLLVHPDKCKHPEAQKAFAMLAKAKEECLDEARIRVMKRTMEDARDLLMHEKKIRAGDPRLETAEFKEEVRKQANKLLIEIEWRKRQLEKKINEEDERKKREQEEERQARKRRAETEKNWEDSRDTRVAGWRTFLDKDKKKKKKLKEKESDLTSAPAMKVAATLAQKKVA